MSEKNVVLTGTATAVPITEKKKRGRKRIHPVVAKTVGKARREYLLREEVLNLVENTLTDKYGECLKVVPYEDCMSPSNYALALKLKDMYGNDVWIKLDVCTPHGSHDNPHYDGYEMSERFKINQEAKTIKESLK